VVHFDGHGVYDQIVGLGMLCFENPADAKANLLKRRAELVDAGRLGSLLRERRVPLFVLEACESARTDQEVTASVAARLLRAGVGSVLAMTHSVLVETARRFVGRFYEGLAQGERIGGAMVAAEHELRDDPLRGIVAGLEGPEELRLLDWFVPVLFQEEGGDLQLLATGAIDPQDLAAEREGREGDLPKAPAHGFVGRARELLAVQRLLRDHRVLDLLGEGGLGKTALAVECARWLLDLRRFERVAFATVEDLPDARVLLDRIGRQLVPGYSVSVAEGTGSEEERLRHALQPVERVLWERRVLLVVDNLETLLPQPGQATPEETEGVLALLAELAKKGETRLLLTSREALPPPLDGAAVRLGPLSKREGRALIAGVLARAGRAPAGEASEQRVDELIETVGGHARSLVLLSPLIAEQGLQVTAESVAGVMKDLEARNPGMRELSLLASIRLSLARLPTDARRQVRALSIFHGPAHVWVLSKVLEVEPDVALGLCRQLADLGLAVGKDPYLFPDPALGPAVADEASEEERRGMEERWLAASMGLIDALYIMYFQDSQIALRGTLAVLQDLMAALAKAEQQAGSAGLASEDVLERVTNLLAIVRAIGRPAALSQLEQLRQRLEGRLADWSHVRFASARAEVEQRLHEEDINGAVATARRLMDRAEATGDSYSGAPYDRASADLMFGRVLRLASRPSEALPYLERAEKRFEEVRGAGEENAARMLGVIAGDRGDALLALGRLEESAESHERGIAIDEQWGNRRSAAVGRFQIGIVRLEQGRWQEALEIFEKAKQIFEALPEPGLMASAWHQIGRAHAEANQWNRAEAAFQEAIRISVELKDKDGQARALNQLGEIYRLQDRLEQSAQLYRQAARLFPERGDLRARAESLSNLSLVLRDLGLLPEAREAATQAIDLKRPFGHAAAPWKTWNILRGIETLAGRAEKAAAAHAQAFETYAAYRRDGGEPQAARTRWIVAVGRALRSQGSSQALGLLPPPEQFDEKLLPTQDALLAIVGGSRNPVLVQDRRLDYDDAVELSLLLESLAGSGEGQEAAEETGAAPPQPPPPNKPPPPRGEGPARLPKEHWLFLPRQPSPIDAGPFAEVEDPSLVFRLLTIQIGRIEGLGAQTIPALELQELLFEGVNVGQDLMGVHWRDSPPHIIPPIFPPPYRNSSGYPSGSASCIIA
jgi:tetratricopeptide (TPR) repeat protein